MARGITANPTQEWRARVHTVAWRPLICRDLLNAVANGLVALTGLLDDPSSPATRRDVEKSIDDVMRVHRLMLWNHQQRVQATGTDGPYLDEWTEAAYIRLTVTFVMLCELLDPLVDRGASTIRHLINPLDFVDVGVIPLDGVPKIAAPRILPDTLLEVSEAAAALYALAGARSPLTPTRLHRLCDKLGRSVDAVLSAAHLPPLLPATFRPSTDPGWKLLDSEKAASSVNLWAENVTPLDIERLVEVGHVVAVPNWGGGKAYPQWQFQDEASFAYVGKVVPSTHPDSRGWPLAILLRSHLCADPGPVDPDSLSRRTGEYLREMGQWVPDWSWTLDGPSPAPIPQKGPPFLLGEGEKLYRVVDKGMGPMFYATYPVPTVPQGKDTIAGGGRFDLPVTTGKGTMYLASSPKACWKQVLDRLSVVTLSDLMNRCQWTLTPVDTDQYPAKPYQLLDIRRSDQASKFNNQDKNRHRTQAFATQVAKVWPGIVYNLQNVPSEDYGYAVALFGKRENSLAEPTPAALGLPGIVFDSEAADSLECDQMWEVVDARREEHPELVVLRLFPDNLVFSEES